MQLGNYCNLAWFDCIHDVTDDSFAEKVADRE